MYSHADSSGVILIISDAYEIFLVEILMTGSAVICCPDDSSV